MSAIIPLSVAVIGRVLQGVNMVTVVYWQGTTQRSEQASSYEEALEIAGRNQNAYSARYYDDRGRELYDDGNGLCYPEPERIRTADGTVIERVVYAV